MAVKVRPEFRHFAMVADDPEALIQRIGRDTWDCVLIDVSGTWVREVFPSQEAAEEACRELGLRYRVGWEDQRLAQRMNRRDHWVEPGGQHRAI